MESKQRRTSYGATFKHKVIVYAEKYGNRKAGREFNVAESNVRLWKQQKLAILQLTQAERHSLALAKEDILTLKYRFCSSFMKGRRMGSL